MSKNRTTILIKNTFSHQLLSQKERARRFFSQPTKIQTTSSAKIQVIENIFANPIFCYILLVKRKL